MTKCLRCGHDSELAFQACLTASNTARKEEARAETAEARCKRLEGALQPFASYADHVDECASSRDLPDMYPITGWSVGMPPDADDETVLRLGACRKARAALSDTAQQETDRG